MEVSEPFLWTALPLEYASERESEREGERAAKGCVQKDAPAKGYARYMHGIDPNDSKCNLLQQTLVAVTKGDLKTRP